MIILIFSLITITLIYCILKYILFFEKVEFKNNFKTTNTQERILLTNIEEYFLAGGEIYTLNLYKNLLKYGSFVKILVVKNSPLEEALKKEKLSYYAYNKFRILNNTVHPAFFRALYSICKKNKINIVHSNIEKEIKTIKKIQKFLPIKIIFNRLVVFPMKDKYIKNLDGIIGINPQITNNLKNLNEEKNYKIKEIDFIPAFFDVKKFLSFQKHKEDKKTFFKNNFSINIDSNIPIITIIASLCDRKKQSLLFQATQKLIFKKNKPIQILCIGEGNKTFTNILFELVEKLDIKKYVHFLGFTTKIPEVLFYSDIKVLPSREEALGIVIAEAALMKKPIIGTKDTGMENIIKHGKTGLLFEKNNVDSLVEQIETFLDNPDLQKELGQNAYDFVKENFAIEKNMEKINKFYKKVLEN